MKHLLNLSDEEVDQLDRLLVHEIDTSRVELRHTDDRTFRDEIRHRLDVVQHLHERMHSAHAEGMGYGSYA